MLCRMIPRTSLDGLSAASRFYPDFCALCAVNWLYYLAEPVVNPGPLRDLVSILPACSPKHHPHDVTGVYALSWGVRTSRYAKGAPS